MSSPPNVRLRLSNRAENVLLVRQALSGLADVVGLDAVALNDLSTAITEAANNVVIHAYRGGEGPLEVELTVLPGSIQALVRDRGTGILPGVEAAEANSGGIGLHVIRTLSDAVEFRDMPGGGTEVAMDFLAPGMRPVSEPEGEGGTELEAVETDDTVDLTLMSVAPTAVARGVVPRVVSTLAARAYFTTDHISDTHLLTDVLVSQADGAICASHLNVGVSVEPRQLEIRLGPLRAGRAGALFGGPAMARLGPVLERLSEGHEVSSSGSSETLDLRLAQRQS